MKDIQQSLFGGGGGVGIFFPHEITIFICKQNNRCIDSITEDHPSYLSIHSF